MENNYGGNGRKGPRNGASESKITFVVNDDSGNSSSTEMTFNELLSLLGRFGNVASVVQSLLRPLMQYIPESDEVPVAQDDNEPVVPGNNEEDNSSEEDGEKEEGRYVPHQDHTYAMDPAIKKKKGE